MIVYSILLGIFKSIRYNVAISDDASFGTTGGAASVENVAIKAARTFTNAGSGA